MNEHIEGADLSAFLDGAVPLKDRAQLDGHLSSCSLCRQELNALRHIKLLVSSAPRRTMPADLALQLEGRLVTRAAPWHALKRPLLWIPAGALAGLALLAGFWLRALPSADELPLEPLLAAHERYSAEGLAAQDNLIASNYSDQWTALYADAPETELQ